MSGTYRDQWISCTANGIEIRGYYLPWGTKRIAYDQIRSAQRVLLGPFNGRARAWGTANLRYWASLDLNRWRKRTGIVLDVGGPVRPLITPAHPDAVLELIAAHTAPGVVRPGTKRAPVI